MSEYMRRTALFVLLLIAAFGIAPSSSRKGSAEKKWYRTENFNTEQVIEDQENPKPRVIMKACDPWCPRGMCDSAQDIGYIRGLSSKEDCFDCRDCHIEREMEKSGVGISELSGPNGGPWTPVADRPKLVKDKKKIGSGVKVSNRRNSTGASVCVRVSSTILIDAVGCPASASPLRLHVDVPREHCHH